MDNFFKDAVISNVKNIDRAIFNRDFCGPCFGDDIVIYANNVGDTTDNYEICSSRVDYEKRIRDSDDKFSMEDYEVFQVIKR